ncbi:hypothetical protein Cantr_03815 [Candida viswanathii]|uniref:Uncharacterized protein n=1 Tax=Candida viswanathii TaxID=5486 RepID=A0A367XNT3_9ASCO|nr:hypothetical protein Cantr_03815 [Candida viswanathii]
MSINGAVLKPDYLQIITQQPQTLPFEVSGDGLETLKYKTRTARQSLQIKHQNNSNHINITATDGYVYLTSKRLVFITATQGDIQSFVVDLNLAPILQLSHKIQAPWFGPNYWEFMFYSALQPSIASDGFPKNQYYKGEIKFNDGGLFQFVEAINNVINDAVNNREIDDSLPQYSVT